jgi:hypothetical protein
MKKLSIIAASLVLAAITSQAQGLINFVNSSSAGSQISTNTVVGGLATGKTATLANGFYYALFSSTSSTVNGGSSAIIPTSGGVGSYAWSDVNWTFDGMATNAASAGRISGPAPLTLPNGFAGGTAYQFLIVGWSSNLGSSIAAVQASLLAGNWSGPAWLGQSGIATLTPGDGALVLTPAAMAASGAISGFTLGVVTVPEPSTMALAALGGASLLLFRRRK